MDIKTPFEDDSHTFKDGPLERFFRMRKWFFLSGIVLLLLDNGWLNFESVAASIAMDRLPKSVLQTGMTMIAMYLLVQAAFVLVQITLTYPRNLRARVQIIESDAVLTLTARLREIGARVAEPDFDLLEDQAKTALAEMSRQLGDDLAHFRKSDEAIKRRISAAEIALDAMRIFPTLIFLTYAIGMHGTLSGLSQL